MPDRPTAEELREHLRRLVDERGDLSLREFADALDIGVQLVHTRWGTWRALRESIGLPPRKRATTFGDSNETMIANLRALAAAEGPEVRQTVYLTTFGYSTELVRGRFGSWPALRRAAGLPDRTTDPRRTITNEQLLDDLRRLWRMLGRFPKWTDVAHHGRYSPSTFQRRVSPSLRTLKAVILRYHYGKVIDEQYGTNHPQREELIEAHIARHHARNRNSRRATRQRAPR